VKIETIEYEKARDFQRRLVADLQEGRGRETALIVTHPPTITLGRKARPENILAPAARLRSMGVAVARTERGGDVTWHGPGQIVAYPIVNLARRRMAPPDHVHALEEAMIAVLGRFGLEGLRLERVRGVFLGSLRGRPPCKVGAVGVAVARGWAFHGLSLNVRVDPGFFSLIVPCGLRDIEATSMHLHLQAPPDPGEVADGLARELRRIYGETLAVRTSLYE
jgi:lipoyl(octanoyl) transferase